MKYLIQLSQNPICMVISLQALYQNHITPPITTKQCTCLQNCLAHLFSTFQDKKSNDRFLNKRVSLEITSTRRGILRWQAIKGVYFLMAECN